MNEVLEQKFLQALERCKSLPSARCKPSSLPCEAIELFCEVGKEPLVLLRLSEQYAAEVEKSINAVWEYAGSVDNWKVDGCPFGVKEHCNILNFFLNVQSKNFDFFRGKDWTPEVICELLKDWKGIDLKVLLSDRSILASPLSAI